MMRTGTASCGRVDQVAGRIRGVGQQAEVGVGKHQRSGSCALRREPDTAGRDQIQVAARRRVQGEIVAEADVALQGMNRHVGGQHRIGQIGGGRQGARLAGIALRIVATQYHVARGRSDRRGAVWRIGEEIVAAGNDEVAETLGGRLREHGRVHDRFQRHGLSRLQRELCRSCAQQRQDAAAVGRGHAAADIEHGPAPLHVNAAAAQVAAAVQAQIAATGYCWRGPQGSGRLTGGGQHHTQIIDVAAGIDLHISATQCADVLPEPADVDGPRIAGRNARQHAVLRTAGARHPVVDELATVSADDVASRTQADVTAVAQEVGAVDDLLDEFGRRGQIAGGNHARSTILTHGVDRSRAVGQPDVASGGNVNAATAGAHDGATRQLHVTRSGQRCQCIGAGQVGTRGEPIRP